MVVTYMRFALLLTLGSVWADTNTPETNQDLLVLEDDSKPAVRRLATPTIEWTKAATGAVCFGRDKACASLAACVKVYLAPCDPAVAAAPQNIAAYMSTSPVDFLAITDSTAKDYLTNTSKTYSMPIYTASGFAKGAHFSASGFGANTTESYASSEIGLWFGDKPAENGLWVAIANYMLLTGSLSSATVNVAYGTVPTASSAQGKDVCMSPRTSAGACGPPISYAPGDMKFSIFGRLHGSAVSVPNSLTHLALRTQIEFYGGFAPVVTFNTGVDTTALAGNDVTKMILTVSGQSLTIEFPTKYNIGDLSHSTGTSDAGLKNPDAARTIKIKAKKASNTAFFIDYVMDSTGFNTANQWFLYDPSVKGTKGTSVKTTSGANGIPVGGFVALLVAAFALQ